MDASSGWELVSLSLEGVRSFKPVLDPNDFGAGQIIDFDQPLNAIHGKNGSGKSTIIETLQLATTGYMPRGTQKGSTYISDPREEGMDKVYGRATLILRRRGAARPTDTDCLSLIWEGMSIHEPGNDSPKTETKRISIYTGASGQRILEAGEVQRLLGLNSAVLRYAVFSTRNDSHSFFAEPGEIKRIFDELLGLKDDVGKLEKLINDEKMIIKELPSMRQSVRDLKKRYDQYNRKMDALQDQQHRLTKARAELVKLEEGKAKAEKDLKWAKEIDRILIARREQSDKIEIHRKHIVQEMSAAEVQTKRRELQITNECQSKSTDVEIKRHTEKINKCEERIKVFEKEAGRYEAECKQHQINCDRATAVEIEIQEKLKLDKKEPIGNLIGHIENQKSVLGACSTEEQQIQDKLNLNKTQLAELRVKKALTTKSLEDFVKEENQLRSNRNKSTQHLKMALKRLSCDDKENVIEELDRAGKELQKAGEDEAALNATIAHLYTLIDELSNSCSKCPMCLRLFYPNTGAEEKQAIINYHKRQVDTLKGQRESGELSKTVASLRTLRDELQNLKEMQENDLTATVEYDCRCKELELLTGNLTKEQVETEAEILSFDRSIKELEDQVHKLKQERLSEITKLDNWKRTVENYITELVLFEQKKKKSVENIKNNTANQESLKKFKVSLKCLEERAVLTRNLNANSAVLDGELELQKLNKKLEEFGNIPQNFSINRYEDAVRRAQQVLHKNDGVHLELEKGIRGLEEELKAKFYREAQKYPEEQQKLEDKKQDLAQAKAGIKYQDDKIVSSHQAHVAQINLALREKWSQFYAGSDIEYIKIRSDPNPASLNLDENNTPTEEESERTSFRKIYNYRVVKCCNGVETNMRDACSSGQKEIACLLIRVVLVEMLAASRLNVLALDDPTCALDAMNAELLVATLSRLISSENSNRSPDQGTLQLIVASQSQEFIRKLALKTDTQNFSHVSRDIYSTIQNRTIGYLENKSTSPSASVGPSGPATAERRVEPDGAPPEKRMRMRVQPQPDA